MVMALGVCASAGAGQAEEPLVSYKSLSPAIALEAAQAAVLDCQRRGYQVTVAIVDRSGMMQAGIRNLPGAVIVGGGLVVEAGGALVGAIGVSGGPGGDADEACAKAG